MPTTYDENSAVRMKDLQRGLVAAAMNSGGGSTTVSNIYFGECNTAGDVQAKNVSIPGFTLTNGARVCIKFTNTNTIYSPTLNINNTGAFPINYIGYPIPSGTMSKNAYLDFVYFNNAYNFVGVIVADADYITIDPVTYDECGNVWTKYGNPTVTSTGAKFGSSLSLDGASYLICDKSMALGTGEYTLECWVKFNATPSQAPLLVQHASGGTPMDFILYILNGKISFVDPTKQYSNLGTTDFVADKWYHIATCRDSSGLTNTYVDGVCELSWNYTGDFSTIFPLAVGGFNNGVSPVNGLMDEVRVSDVCRYSGNSFTPPTEPFTVDAHTKVLLHFD